ncbi:MAG: hypothetical protein MRY79_06830 [Alphaproteobacteria bacterium]|nr:hypothetical protein [Alphaproteobacteria bacterium]
MTPLVMCLFSFGGSEVIAQDGGAGGEFPMSVNIMESIIVESDVSFDVEFASAEARSLNFIDASEAGQKRQNPKTGPAQLRIIGAPAMAMVEVEVDKMTARDENGEAAVSIYDFDIGQKDAGNSVTIMPFADDEVILLGIGAKAEGKNSAQGQYVGINVINVNYL